MLTQQFCGCAACGLWLKFVVQLFVQGEINQLFVELFALFVELFALFVGDTLH